MARTTPQHPANPAHPHGAPTVQQVAATLASNYALSPSDVTQLASGIAAARDAAYKAAYVDAMSQIVGEMLTPSQFEFPAATSAQQRQAAHAAASGIAQTYAHDLGTRTQSLAQQYSDQHNGDLSNATPTLNDIVQTWAANHAAWKGAQISNVETGQAANDATRAALDQLQNGDISLPDGVSVDDYVVEVHPAMSSSDVCSQYAGNQYTLDQASDLPDFPIHPNCIHELVISYIGTGLDSVGQLQGMSAADALASPEPGTPEADRLFSRIGPWAVTVGEHERLQEWRHEHTKDEQADAQAAALAAAQQQQDEQAQALQAAQNDEDNAEYQSELAETQPGNPDEEQQGINPLVSAVGEDDAADAAQELDDDDFPDLIPDLTPAPTSTALPDTTPPRKPKPRR